MTEFVIKDIKDARLIKSGEIVSIALPKSTDGSWSVEAPVIGAYINPNDCGEIGGWDIPENEDIPSNVDGTEQVTKPDDFCSWRNKRTNDA